MNRNEYTAFSETSFPDDMASPVVANQPSALSDVENYVLDLDASQVETWSPEDVVNMFLTRINCDYANELFLANRINGKALMLLHEDHLKEMGIHTIGDRVYMLEMIQFLKKKKKQMETTQELWTGQTPYGPCEYSNDPYHCCQRYCCPCCVLRTDWKVTGQGVFHRESRKFGSVSTVYLDYRFFKDLELKEEHLCCCFCKRTFLEMYVNDAESKNSENADVFKPPYVLFHPEAPKVEKIVRNAWHAARLVAE